MTRSRSALADAIERLVSGERVALTETRDGIVLNQLQGNDAGGLINLLEADNWTVTSIADEGGGMTPEAIHDDDFGITVTATKPEIPADVEAILTTAGLAAALARTTFSGRVWLHGLTNPFETQSVRFAPWGDETPFAILDEALSPRRFVRVLDDGSRFPDDLRRWLLRDPESAVVGRTIEPWRRMAVERLSQSLADEIEPDGSLLFRGPPATRFTPVAGTLVEAGGLEALQRAAQWVFENTREIENRHVLLAAEIARTALTGGSVTDFSGLSRTALESAKIAYNFGVTQQSRDTLKALTELRKAVTEETSKLAENARSLAAALAGSLVANLTIIIARLTAPNTSKWVPAAAITIGLVLAVYVVTLVWSGTHYLNLQATLRSEWRQRLYRFLEDDEYERMVSTPVERAEQGYRITSYLAILMALLLFFAVWKIAGAA